MFLLVVNTLICTASIVSNISLLYLISIHTPKALKSYSTMLMTLSVYELITSFSKLIVFPRIVPLGFEGIACVYSGPCAHVNSIYPCFLLYSFVLHGFTAYNLQITANFCFRYYVLIRGDPGVSRVLRLNLLLLVPTLLCGWLFMYAPSPENLVRDLIGRLTPQYDFSDNKLIGLIDLPHSWALPSIFLIVATAFPCTLINIIVGRTIKKFLYEHAKRFSSRWRSTHQEFLMALSFQAMVSQLFLLAVATYVIGQLNIVRDASLEYATHMIGGCCLISSPLLTIYYVRPYRRQIFRPFRRSASKIVPLNVWAGLETSQVPANQYIQK